MNKTPETSVRKSGCRWVLAALVIVLVAALSAWLSSWITLDLEDLEQRRQARRVPVSCLNAVSVLMEELEQQKVRGDAQDIRRAVEDVLRRGGFPDDYWFWHDGPYLVNPDLADWLLDPFSASEKPLLVLGERSLRPGPYVPVNPDGPAFGGADVDYLEKYVEMRALPPWLPRAIRIGVR